MNQSAYAKALKILLSRPHFESELRAKLLARDVPEQDLAPIMDDLKKRKYIDDEEQSALYVNELCRKGFGPFYVTGKLAQKGFDFDTAGRIVERIYTREMEKENLARLIKKKNIKTGGDLQMAERKKAFDSLRRKGFSAELVLEFLKLK